MIILKDFILLLLKLFKKITRCLNWVGLDKYNILFQLIGLGKKDTIVF